VVAVLAAAHLLDDLLARRTHGELVRVAPRHPHLAAQRDHGLARDGRLHDLLLAHVVREAFGIPRLDELLGLGALEHARRRARAVGAEGRRGVVRRLAPAGILRRAARRPAASSGTTPPRRTRLAASSSSRTVTSGWPCSTVAGHAVLTGPSTMCRTAS